MQTPHAQVVQVPSGPIMRSRARKLRDSLQALVCSIKDCIGEDMRTIEDFQLKEFLCVTLLQFVVSNEE